MPTGWKANSSAGFEGFMGVHDLNFMLNICECPTCVLGTDRPLHRSDLRLVDRVERLLCRQGLSRAFAAYPFQRPRVGQDAGVADQQHNLAAVDHRRALQKPLAGGVVLQMDQAASAHQALSGHERERGEDANLVRRIHLCAHRHRQEGASPRYLALHK